MDAQGGRGADLREQADLQHSVALGCDSTLCLRPERDHPPVSSLRSSREALSSPDRPNCSPHLDSPGVIR